MSVLLIKIRFYYIACDKARQLFFAESIFRLWLLFEQRAIPGRR
jgi:hypothetical protein